MNTAIIVAAGSGSRFGSDIPKQFIEVLGKPVIIHTLERFRDSPAVDAVVVVLSEERMSDLEGVKVGFGKPLIFVSGGDTRAASVLNGLNAVPDPTKIVLVHDGARPLVSAEEIENVINAAGTFGAACLTAAVTDTIKRVKDDGITETVDRRELRRALTPQAFKLDILRRAFDNGDALDELASDESYLVEKLGVKVRSVPGNSANIKITYQEDLLLAEALLRNGRA